MLVPGREDDQTKLQYLVMELKAARRHGEDEEEACVRLLERIATAPEPKSESELPVVSESQIAASLGAPTTKTVAVSEHSTAAARPADVTPPPTTADDLRVFLTSLGLAHLEPRFVENDFDFAMLSRLGEEALRNDLTDIGISVGARRRIMEALEERATAATKAAALKAAEEEMQAAAVQQQHDEERIKQMKKEIEELEKVIGKREVPKEIVCPITTDIMADPVLAADGHTYERSALKAWLDKSDSEARSPSTNLKLAHKILTPNFNVRSAAERFLEECRAAGTDPDSLT